MHFQQAKTSDRENSFNPAASSGTGLGIQCQLIVGNANDPLEAEADAMADRVMRMPDTPLVERKSAECVEGDKQLQRKPLAACITPFIQTKGAEGGAISEAFSSQLGGSKGGGKHMDNNTQTFMESRFGTDLSHVNIHVDGESAAMNQSLHAKAFTLGSDIYFNHGQYRPDSSEGRHLLAHELAHTVQQSIVGQTLQRKLRFTGNPDHLTRTVALLNSGLGNFYYVSIDKTGEIKIEPIRAAHTSSITGPTAQQKALADRLWTVTNDSKDVIMSVSSGSKTLVGSWVTADFDIADVETVGVGAMIHEIVEQYQKQAKGVTKFGTATTGAHGEASKAESEVTGLTRGADKVISMTQNADGTMDAVIETLYVTSDGKTKTMVSTITHNNVVSITWK